MTESMKKRLTTLLFSVVLAAFSCQAAVLAESEEADTNSEYAAGMYKVGEDLPAGEYIVFADNGMGYFCVSADSNQDDITFNSNFDYNSIITVNDGEYLELKRCYAVLAEEDPDVDTDGSGMFLIGTHLPAGEYKLDSGDEMGYYCIYASSRQDDIVANDNFEGQNYVEVTDGQYLVLNRCAIVDADEEAAEETIEEGAEAASYGSGVYKVGEDIPAGEYVVFADEDSKGYFCVSADSNGKNILFNENFDYNSIITVNEGEYLDLSRSYAVPLSEDPDVDVDGTGMFLVGTHIQAGEYQLDSGDEKGYYCVYDSSRQDNIVANDNFEGQNYVTVSDGQYLVLSRCAFTDPPEKPEKTYTDTETVMAVQKALNDAGYDCGTPDGIAGEGTEAAIMEYQTDHDLEESGTITDDLLDALEIKE